MRSTIQQRQQWDEDGYIVVQAFEDDDLPTLGVFNFVLEAALSGGVNDSLATDMHGKNRGMILLCMEIDVPAEHWAAAAEH